MSNNGHPTGRCTRTFVVLYRCGICLKVVNLFEKPPPPGELTVTTVVTVAVTMTVTTVVARITISLVHNILSNRIFSACAERNQRAGHIADSNTTYNTFKHNVQHIRVTATHSSYSDTFKYNTAFKYSDTFK